MSKYAPKDDNILTFGKDIKQKMTMGGKWETKYDNNPPVGKYDVEAAEKAIRPKSPATIIREPLNLYTKPASIRPEVNTEWIKPFGADVKDHITMGSKYETKIVKYPTPRNIDYDALMNATKPKVSGGGFAGAATAANT